MTVLGSTFWVGFALRLLMVAACVLPFSNPRQAAAAFGTVPAPTSERLPSPPANEEDERESGEDASERVADPRSDRRPEPAPLPAGLVSNFRLSGRPVSYAQSVPSRPTAADPFRNGLGTPYRC